MRRDNRIRAIQDAVQEKLERMKCNCLTEECIKLDPSFEQRMAEEDMPDALAGWPKY